VSFLNVKREPFPHVVIDDWWDSTLLRNVLDEFPAPDNPGWQRFENDQERKLAGPPRLWGSSTLALYNEIEDRGVEIGEAFGIQDLKMETVGGGYHCIEPGGFLQIHADFNRSPKTNRFRRLNLLIYLNDQWNDPGGHLELWDKDGPIADIAPEFNRTVIFETSDHSWHGHPTPAKRWRRSVAAYFFTEEAPQGYSTEHSTIWHH